MSKRKEGKRQRDANNAKRQVGTVDLTPTWASMVPMIVMGLSGPPKQSDAAMIELRRMASLADKYVAAARVMAELGAVAAKSLNMPLVPRS